MDKIISKEYFPEEFLNKIKTLGELTDENYLEQKQVIRSVMSERLSERKKFYWYNQKRMNQFEQIKERLGVIDSTETFNEVMPSVIYRQKQFPLLQINGVEQEVLWINGKHDFLMGGDVYQAREIFLFDNSGHYPHIEEDDKFIKKLNMFLLI